jgi:hypothetical protein
MRAASRAKSQRLADEHRRILSRIAKLRQPVLRPLGRAGGRR